MYDDYFEQEIESLSGNRHTATSPIMKQCAHLHNQVECLYFTSKVGKSSDNKKIQETF